MLATLMKLPDALEDFDTESLPVSKGHQEKKVFIF
jgi:hypothetical protein